MKPPTPEKPARKCPICGKPPIIVRHRFKTYWQVRCEMPHLSNSSACPMKTKRDAWAAWDEKFKQEKQN